MRVPQVHVDLPRRVLALLVVPVFLAGCGEDRGEKVGTGTGTGTTATTESKEPAGPVSATVAVKETEYKLAPQNPTVRAPGVVEFRVSNGGSVDHALEVEGPEGEVETDTIEPGGTATLKADLSKPGSYTWYCPVGNHKDLGMEGKITVGARRTATTGTPPSDSDDKGGETGDGSSGPGGTGGSTSPSDEDTGGAGY